VGDLRPSGQNHEWRDAFIDAIRETGVVRHALRIAGVARSTAYDLRAADPGFAAEWADAVEDFKDVVEAELLRRAVTGTDKPVFQGGVEVGAIREYSDTLLLAYLNAHAMDRGYVRQSRMELTGRDGGPLAIAASADGLERAERIELRDMLRAEKARRLNALNADGGDAGDR